jgi:pimeloyl-ACP methyl ester carboxylesterase
MTLSPVALSTGVTLDVRDSGPRDAPALVFLHGFPENHRSWRHQIAHLEARFRCIAPDQRGYGRSSKPAEVADYAIEHLVADVFALADALGIAHFTVIGHDWGGIVAWVVAMAGQHNGRVDRAIIANAPHPAFFARLQFLDSRQRRASQYIRAFRDRANDPLVRRHGLGAMLVRAFAGWDIPADFDAECAATMLAQGMEPAERNILLAQWADPTTAFAMLNWYRASPIDVPALDQPYALPADWAPPPLPRLTLPVQVIWGMDDNALVPANLDGLGDWVADAAIAPIPGVGHFVTWQAPEAVSAEIARFLA